MRDAQRCQLSFLLVKPKTNIVFGQLRVTCHILRAFLSTKLKENIGVTLNSCQCAEGTCLWRSAGIPRLAGRATLQPKKIPVPKLSIQSDNHIER